MTLTLYWCPRTRASRIVWMAEELRMDYDLEHIDIRDPESSNNAAFKAASPMGKVPAIADGDVRMADSAAICLYLADCYALGELAPELDDPRRGQYLYWMIYTPGVIEPAMVEKFSGVAPNRGQHGWGDFDSMIDIAEQALTQGPWLFGDWFTAADVMLGSSFSFMRQFNILPSSKVLESYVERCQSRPAFVKAMQMDSV